MPVKDKKVLFILFGGHKRVNDSVALRLGKLGYLDRKHVFTDLEYEKSSQLTCWKKENKDSALITITDMVDPGVKAIKIKEKFDKVFDVVLPVELEPSPSFLLMKDDDFRDRVNDGIHYTAAMKNAASEEERLEIYAARRKKRREV